MTLPDSEISVNGNPTSTTPVAHPSCGLLRLTVRSPSRRPAPADGLNPESAPVGNGKTLGIPSNLDKPDLIPAVATNSKSGWVDHHLLTEQADPQLTPEGTSQAPIPFYGADGTTVVGKADVSQPYRR